MLDLDDIREQAKQAELNGELLACMRPTLEWYRITVHQLCAEVDRLRQESGHTQEVVTS